MSPLNDEPVYVISVAARLVQCHPQTLRTYERLGLIEPRRSGSNVRLYSEHDVQRLLQIQRLTQELGVNLAGVEIILKLLEQVEGLHDEIQRLRKRIEEGPKSLPGASSVRIEIQA